MSKSENTRIFAQENEAGRKIRKALATLQQQREAVKGEDVHEITGAELVGENVVLKLDSKTWTTVPAAMLAQPVLEWDAQRGAGGHAGGEATCESCPAFSVGKHPGVGLCHAEPPQPRSTNSDWWCMRHPRRKWAGA